MGKGMDNGFGTPATPGFGVKGLEGVCTRTAGARRFCCDLAVALGRDVLLVTAVVAVGGIGGFGRRGGCSAGGSGDVIGRAEACRGKGTGNGVAGAATITAGTASIFNLALGETAFVEAAPFAFFTDGGLVTACIGGFVVDGLAADTFAPGGFAVAAVGGEGGFTEEVIAARAFAGDPGAEDGSPEGRRRFLRLYLCFESSPALSPPSLIPAGFLEEDSTTLLTRAAVNI